MNVNEPAILPAVPEREPGQSTVTVAAARMWILRRLGIA